MTPTTEYAVAFSSGAAACMYVFRQVFAVVRENKRDKEYGNGNGERRPMTFWIAKFDSLDGHAKRQTEILDKQTELLQKQSETLVELLTITKLKARL